MSSKTKIVGGVGAATVLVAVAAGCGAGASLPVPPAAPPAVPNLSDLPTEHPVTHTYKLEANVGQRSTVSYDLGINTHDSEVVEAGKKWSITLTVEKEPYDFYTMFTVVPVETDLSLGDVPDLTCKITRDGKVVDERTSDYAVYCGGVGK